MALHYTCDRKGCGQELDEDNHARIMLDGSVYDICKQSCLAPAGDIKRRIDELGRMHAEAYKREVELVKGEYLKGLGRR